jgi:hypothetical protein
MKSEAQEKMRANLRPKPNTYEDGSIGVVVGDRNLSGENSSTFSPFCSARPMALECAQARKAAGLCFRLRRTTHQILDMIIVPAGMKCPEVISTAEHQLTTE